ncbi:hypothetical protein ABT173_14180 [Streptomyces sp. NPDC001795]|uniref:hypothetical protein n=1 Tax=unclassified Streptomyces TaxID=2593676 RepID=UPI00331905DB
MQGTRTGWAVAALAVTLTTAGCGSSGSAAPASSSQSSSAAKPASTGSAAPAAVAGGCGSYTAGKNGVVRTFCEGPAQAKVTVGGRDYVLKGGTCEASGGLWSVNIGVVIDATHKGAPPDYFGANLPLKGGAFSGADMDVNVGGKGYPLKASGTVSSDRRSGTFSGKQILGDATVTGSFTC